MANSKRVLASIVAAAVDTICALAKQVDERAQKAASFIAFGPPIITESIALFVSFSRTFNALGSLLFDPSRRKQGLNEARLGWRLC